MKIKNLPTTLKAELDHIKGKFGEFKKSYHYKFVIFLTRFKGKANPKKIINKFGLRWESEKAHKLRDLLLSLIADGFLKLDSNWQFTSVGKSKLQILIDKAYNLWFYA